MTEHPQFVYDGSVDPECQNGCPEGCGGTSVAFLAIGIPGIGCGLCCDCLGGCRIAYYRQQEAPEQEFHWGPDPGHGGLTKHIGRRENCAGPSCNE